MTILTVPDLDEGERFPTLGRQVCAFIRENMVHGPGDLRGEPARLDREKEALIHRVYEVYPRGHPNAGRRRFRRVGISLRKGSAKTEFGAWLVACELHPDAPVRCVGWDGDDPLGGGVTDPYIPLVAYTEEQSEELAYGTLLVVLGEGPLAGDFDLGLSRIIRRDGTGRAVALAGAPGPRDGARTTFQLFDETHRMALPNQKAAHRTMLANLPKRKAADPWSLEVTTAYAPGEGSVAESTFEYARQVHDGAISDSRLFFFHREASAAHDLTSEAGLHAAVTEASGPVAEWSDIGGIIEQWQDPTADTSFLERVWLNRPVQAASRAFDVQRWKELGGERDVEKGALVTIGFDGARFRDSTALVGCEVATGHLFLLGFWSRPYGVAEWGVPVNEVNESVAAAFDRFEVWRMYADPPYWEETVNQWAGKYGEERVQEWWTNRSRPIGHAVRAFHHAIVAGDLSHDGNAGLTRHIGHAVRRHLQVRDDEGRKLWTIQKERPDSPHKIDAAMAAVLSWEARGDAVAAGMLKPQKSRYEQKGARLRWI